MGGAINSPEAVAFVKSGRDKYQALYWRRDSSHGQYDYERKHQWYE